MIALLDEPLGDGDAAAGWTDTLRFRWRDYFLELRRPIAAGERPVDDARHVLEWLRFDGLTRGPLIAAIAELQRELVSAYERRRWGVGDVEASRFLHQIGVRR